MRNHLVLDVPAHALDPEDDDALYLEVLCPLMEHLGHASTEGETTWDVSPSLTRTQVTLGLCGLAQLEILNGGVAQLMINGLRQALDVPAALREIGAFEAAEAAQSLLSQYEQGLATPAASRKPPVDPVDQFREAVLHFRLPPEAEAVEAGMAETLQSPGFRLLLANAVRCDVAGFRIADA